MASTPMAGDVQVVSHLGVAQRTARQPDISAAILDAEHLYGAGDFAALPIHWMRLSGSAR
jgi:hypothetical protein